MQLQWKWYKKLAVVQTVSQHCTWISLASFGKFGSTAEWPLCCWSTKEQKTSEPGDLQNWDGRCCNILLCPGAHSNRKHFNTVQKPERMKNTLFTSLANFLIFLMISQWYYCNIFWFLKKCLCLWSHVTDIIYQRIRRLRGWSSLTKMLIQSLLLLTLSSVLFRRSSIMFLFCGIFSLFVGKGHSTFQGIIPIR